MTGTIEKIMDKGYGFIKVDGAPQGSRNLFFHFNSRVDRMWEPEQGQPVEFEMKTGMKGPEAANVQYAGAQSQSSSSARDDQDEDDQDAVVADSDDADDQDEDMAA
jgi:cold shock CspA family protein